MHAYMHACMHTCIHAYMHTCIHAYMHTCIHAYMHTSIHPYIHPSIHPYIQTDRHTHIHTYTHTHIHTDTQDTQTYRHTDIQTHRHTDTQTHRHTDIQTHIHTYTHIHIYTFTYTYNICIYIFIYIYIYIYIIYIYIYIYICTCDMCTHVSTTKTSKWMCKYHISPMILVNRPFDFDQGVSHALTHSCSSRQPCFLLIWFGRNSRSEIKVTSLGIMVSKGNHPQTTRLVKYQNLFRIMALQNALILHFAYGSGRWRARRAGWQRDSQVDRQIDSQNQSGRLIERQNDCQH